VRLAPEGEAKERNFAGARKKKGACLQTNLKHNEEMVRRAFRRGLAREKLAQAMGDTTRVVPRVGGASRYQRSEPGEDGAKIGRNSQRRGHCCASPARGRRGEIRVTSASRSYLMVKVATPEVDNISRRRDQRRVWLIHDS